MKHSKKIFDRTSLFGVAWSTIDRAAWMEALWRFDENIQIIAEESFPQLYYEHLAAYSLHFETGNNEGVKGFSWCIKNNCLELQLEMS